jgi:hypothetical protein
VHRRRRRRNGGLGGLVFFHGLRLQQRRRRDGARHVATAIVVVTVPHAEVDAAPAAATVQIGPLAALRPLQPNVPLRDALRIVNHSHV